ncbi:cinnamate beta-D-glucosyltransferase-like [Dorcoceras hygrometricum]|uniref:Cinnamate beta-D-glucosyltransferase-like n=1 Tax=Dorcoceras hygrometricum TaxID=472368 RepID=A0A2Z7BDP3_9LAMI|nr:cinnamate beta-D-glucosyltransferase-like [Dorcoceras hygrometricum]
MFVDRISRTIGDSTIEVLLPHKTGIVGAGRDVTKDNSQTSYGHTGSSARHSPFLWEPSVI